MKAPALPQIQMYRCCWDGLEFAHSHAMIALGASYLVSGTCKFPLARVDRPQAAQGRDAETLRLVLGTRRLWAWRGGGAISKNRGRGFVIFRLFGAKFSVQNRDHLGTTWIRHSFEPMPTTPQAVFDYGVRFCLCHRL